MRFKSMLVCRHCALKAEVAAVMGSSNRAVTCWPQVRSFTPLSPFAVGRGGRTLAPGRKGGAGACGAHGEGGPAQPAAREQRHSAARL